MVAAEIIVLVLTELKGVQSEVHMTSFMADLAAGERECFWEILRIAVVILFVVRECAERDTFCMSVDVDSVATKGEFVDPIPDLGW